jgi:gliding motility-associated peptidyl-prolyl isomerase
VSDLNNVLIYSQETIGEKTYMVDQQDIIEGLRNGLKLMNEGDIVTFLFPSHKVYGYSGDENKIGINQPLIYKVKLNKINKKK